MTGTILGGIVRAVLAYLGGTQYASDNEIEQLIGALALIATIGWSVVQKITAKEP